MSEPSSILKPNATRHNRAIERAIRIGDPDLTPVARLMNPDTCPAHLLGWLAWAMSVDVWDPDWSEAVKRDVIRQSVPVHRMKGTRRAVEAALAAIGVDAEIVEWFEQDEGEPLGVPGTFEIWIGMQNVLDLGSALPELLEELKRVVDAAKPVSAHYTARARVVAPVKEYAGATAWFQGGTLSNVAGLPPFPAVPATVRMGVTCWMNGAFNTPTLEVPNGQ